MTSTLCRSDALGRIIAPWVEIAEFFCIIVKSILSIMQNVSEMRHDIFNFPLSAMKEGAGRAGESSFCLYKDYSLTYCRLDQELLIQPLAIFPELSLEGMSWEVAKASKSPKDRQKESE